MQSVVDLATIYKWKTFHDFDARHSAAGWPDLALLRGGELLFLEFKTEKGKVSPEQIEWIEGLNLVKGEVYAYVVRPGDFDFIRKLLKP